MLKVRSLSPSLPFTRALNCVWLLKRWQSTSAVVSVPGAGPVNTRCTLEAAAGDVPEHGPQVPAKKTTATAAKVRTMRAFWCSRPAQIGLCSKYGRVGAAAGTRNPVSVVRRVGPVVGRLEAWFCRRTVKLQGALVPALPERLDRAQTFDDLDCAVWYLSRPPDR